MSFNQHEGVLVLVSAPRSTRRFDATGYLVPYGDMRALLHMWAQGELPREGVIRLDIPGILLALAEHYTRGGTPVVRSVRVTGQTVNCDDPLASRRFSAVGVCEVLQPNGGSQGEVVFQLNKERLDDIFLKRRQLIASESCLTDDQREEQMAKWVSPAWPDGT